MSDTLSFADIDGQHVELLPARITMQVGGGGTGDGGTEEQLAGHRLLGMDLELPIPINLEE